MASLESGGRLGPYEIEAPAGAGGIGEVYRAKNTRPGRTVAIQILPSHLRENEDLRKGFDTEDESAHEQFSADARRALAGRRKWHERVP